jgi:hypothetical protein
VLIVTNEDIQRLQRFLKPLKEERKNLIATWGTKGQKHYMGRMIGGLNPAAQRLGYVRHQIADLEAQIKKLKEKESHEKAFKRELAGKPAKKQAPRPVKYFHIETGEGSTTKKKNYQLVSEDLYPVYKRLSGRVDYTGWIYKGVKHDRYIIDVKTPANVRI